MTFFSRFFDLIRPPAKVIPVTTATAQQGWPNGTTQTYDPGTPPANWKELNGWFYPPSTLLPFPVDVIGRPVSSSGIPSGSGTFQPVTPDIIGGTISFPIFLEVLTVPAPIYLPITVGINVLPAIPTFDPATVTEVVHSTLIPIPVFLGDGMRNSMRRLLTGKIESYFDEDRELKTVLNFGGDFQALMTKWMFDPADVSGSTILAKLYRPLPDEVTPKSQVWISRELAPPVIDQVRVQFTPDDPVKVYLRPANFNMRLAGYDGAYVDNVTLNTLFSTGSTALIRPSDPVIEEWYTDDVNDAELNIDYADYRNFVFFSSATSRLNAFVQKLRTLEDLDSVLTKSSASLAVSGALAVTGSSVYQSVKKLGEQRIDMLRSFDGYERFLYYKSGIPYSASLNTDDAQDAIYYNADATFPKLNGKVVPVISGSTWINAQLTIAQEYDRGNPNYLGNNIPSYLKDDSTAGDFTKFVDLIGHHFDGIKSHIDQMSNIFDRNSDPDVGLSKDMVWNVAHGFGIEMPNPNAIRRLVDYTIGDIQSVTATTYREVTAEIWKRFLHNQIFMMKSKGTKASLRALMNAYGVLPTVLQIREGVISGTTNITGSFEVFEEQTNTLDIPASASVMIPWYSSGNPPLSMEVRFASTTQRDQVLLNTAGNTWAVKLIHTSGTLGYVTLVSGSTMEAISAVLPIFDGDYFSVMARYKAGGTDLKVKRATGDVIEYASEVSEPGTAVADVWNLPVATNIFLGGSGSYFGTPFVGQVDEFRVWSEFLNDDTFNMHVLHSGLYNGNTLTSARDNLLVRLSFNKSKNLGSSPVLSNESPYTRLTTTPSQYLQFTASLFPNRPTAPNNMNVVSRTVLRYTPNAGASQFSSNKIVIADSPTLVVDSNNVPMLDPARSIVTIAQKRERANPDNTIGFYFSVTDAINDNIMKTFGNIDLQNYIGDPRDSGHVHYDDLQTLNDLYWNQYAYGINVNQFIEFVRNLLEPMFRQAKHLVPIRSKLISGIVHEPHILERSKLVETNPFSIQSGIARDNSEEQNLFAKFGSIVPLTALSEFDTYQTTLPVNNTTVAYAESDEYDSLLLVNKTCNPQAESDTIESLISVSNTNNPLAENDSFETTVSTFNSTVLNASYAVLDDITNAVAFRQELLIRYKVSGEEQLTASQLAEMRAAQNFYRNPNTITVGSGMNQYVIDYPPLINTILPISDWGDIGSREYFMDPNGIIGTEGYTNVRVNQSILNNAGMWSGSITYNLNDFVTQSIDPLADGAEGNGKEYVCISSFGTVKSPIPPSLDPRNWSLMRYVPTRIPVPKKAIIVSGSVSIAPLTSTMPPAVGYMPYHFKFTRDRRRGIRNHQYLGCKQDDTTTTDGKPVVEIFGSSTDTLIVHNPGDPIQPTNDSTGPILDVQ